MLHARPELTTLDSPVDAGFRVFAVVCAVGMLLARLLAPPASGRQPNWPETLVVVTGILFEAGGYSLAGSLLFIGGMAAWLIRYARMAGHRS